MLDSTKFIIIWKEVSPLQLILVTIKKYNRKCNHVLNLEIQLSLLNNQRQPKKKNYLNCTVAKWISYRVWNRKFPSSIIRGFGRPRVDNVWIWKTTNYKSLTLGAWRTVFSWDPRWGIAQHVLRFVCSSFSSSTFQQNQGRSGRFCHKTSFASDFEGPWEENTRKDIIWKNKFINQI